jgi:hypothetical protein
LLRACCLTSDTHGPSIVSGSHPSRVHKAAALSRSGDRGRGLAGGVDVAVDVVDAGVADGVAWAAAASGGGASVCRSPLKSFLLEAEGCGLP